MGSSTDRWRPVSTLGLGATSAGFLLLAWLLLTDSDGYIRILDDANLVFHEAGHPIFGLLGSTLGLYGGTLGQLLFPSLAAIAFWRRKEPLSVAVGLGWFFENFFSIARYMADARAQVLPLVGGGQHDWEAIFGGCGLLSSDTRIAAVVRTLGWLGLAATWVWLYSCWRRNRLEGRAQPDEDLQPGGRSPWRAASPFDGRYQRGGLAKPMSPSRSPSRSPDQPRRGSIPSASRPDSYS